MYFKFLIQKLTALIILLFLYINGAYAQITNSNLINYEVYVDSVYQGCDNDNERLFNTDDNVVRLQISTDANTGGTITRAVNSDCTNAYLVNWKADAPSSHTVGKSIYSAINRTNIADMLNLNLQTWEDDKTVKCSMGSHCNFTGNYTLTFKNATKFPNQWWGYTGTAHNSNWTSTSTDGRAKIKTVWRYAKGNDCSNPLTFGTLSPSSTYKHTNSNRVSPTNARAEMGYTNTVGNASADVYYSFSISQPSTVVISTVSTTTNYDTYLRLYNSDCSTELAYNDDAPSSSNASTITIDLCAGSYKILVEGYSNNTGIFELSVKSTLISGNGGAITQNTTAYCPNDLLGSFSNAIAATGMGNITYQWQMSTTSNSTGYTDIANANSITFTPNNINVNGNIWIRRKATDECNRAYYSNTISITPNILSTALTSITGTETICNGSSTLLSANGMTLGTGASIKWYTNNCGGTSIGTGANISVAPTTTTTYYARVEGTCNTTTCANFRVNVNQLSNDLLINNIPTIHCPNTDLVLSANATLGTNASIKWYSEDNGNGTLLGTGNTLTVAPNETTTYYARVEGTCNTTTSVAATIKVRNFVYAADATMSENYCTDNNGWHHFYQGENIILSLKGNLSNTVNPIATIRKNTTHYQDRTLSHMHPASCANGWSPGEERFEMARSWNIDYTGTLAGNYTVRFYFDNTEKTSVQNIANTFANTYLACGYSYKYGNWHWFKNANATYQAPLFEDILLTDFEEGNSANIHYVDLKNISTFSGGSGGLILTPLSALPIELLYFTAQLTEQKQGQLNWATASEYNNNYFEIQRSNNASNENFESIGIVSSLGNSNSIQSYNFLDTNPHTGVNYYRLKQVDFDGTFTYSNIVAINVNMPSNFEAFYPNPTIDKVQYQFANNSNEKVEIRISNALGQVVETYTQAAQIGNNIFTISLENLPEGIYFITATHLQSNKVTTQSIIKTK